MLKHVLGSRAMHAPVRPFADLADAIELSHGSHAKPCIDSHARAMEGWGRRTATREILVGKAACHTTVVQYGGTSALPSRRHRVAASEAARPTEQCIEGLWAFGGARGDAVAGSPRIQQSFALSCRSRCDCVTGLRGVLTGWRNQWKSAVYAVLSARRRHLAVSTCALPGTMRPASC